MDTFFPHSFNILSSENRFGIFRCNLATNKLKINETNFTLGWETGNDVQSFLRSLVLRPEREVANIFYKHMDMVHRN